MLQVPGWWVWASGVYFALSIVWTLGLCVGVWMLYSKVTPILTEAKVQLHRVSDQAKNIASRVSNTADSVHTQAQRLLGSADSAGSQVTRQARTVGAALTGILVAVRVIHFVRKIF